MKILLVPDKFKGSLSAKEVIESLSVGIRQIYPEAEIHSVLASDGGDGFLNAISMHRETQSEKVITVDPLGRQIEASYLWHPETASAYIELARASGMELLKEEERNPLKTSTYGTGLQIRHAIAKGAKAIYVGLGGSATNDGGIGMAKALGYIFTDVHGKEISPKGKNLLSIHKIKQIGEQHNLDAISFFAINDVNNPLFGKNGAAHVYARQKGASAKDIHTLDLGLVHLDVKVKEHMGMEVADIPGAGAAGGAAYGLKAFFKAEFINGIDFILDLAQADSLLREQKFDYIVTGEGKIDDQTLNGKLIKGVIDLGNRFDVPVIGICGKLDIDDENLKRLGLWRVIEIGDATKSLQYNMDNASVYMKNATVHFFELLQAE